MVSAQRTRCIRRSVTRLSSPRSTGGADLSDGLRNLTGWRCPRGSGAWTGLHRNGAVPYPCRFLEEDRLLWADVVHQPSRAPLAKEAAFLRGAS